MLEFYAFSKIKNLITYRFPCIRGRRAAPPCSDSKRTTLAGLSVFEKLYGGILLLLLLLVLLLSMVVIVDSKVEKVCRYLLQLIIRSTNNSLSAFFEDWTIIMSKLNCYCYHTSFKKKKN